MKRIIVLAISAAVVGCSASDSQGSSGSSSSQAELDFQEAAPSAPEIDQPTPQVSQMPQVNAALESKYAKAVECVALTDVVKTLVESDVITQPEIVRYAAQAKGVWQDKAISIGREKGSGASDVLDDVARKAIPMLEPLKTDAPDQARMRIQSLVRRAGDCPI